MWNAHIYRQLCECSDAMAGRLKAGAYSDADMQTIVPSDGPTKDNLVGKAKR